jgi:uncharacterized protein with NRDE domain
MCLLVLAWQAHPRYRLIVAANRDEFHERPAAPLAKWPAPAGILAGQDLRAHGTWLGLDRLRRFGVVTNFRDLQRPQPEAPSRGDLIPRFLQPDNAAGPGDFLAGLEPRAAAYSGFNLLLADQESLWYGCNRAEPFRSALAPGIYGLSNQFLDTPWPKLRRVRRRFEAWLERSRAAPPGEPSAEALFALLDDRTTVAEEDLPQTGLSAEWERILSAPFVLHPDYGTRSSTVLLLEASGACVLVERRFDPQGALSGESRFELGGGEWP